jgi:hypothetical protein
MEVEFFQQVFLYFLLQFLKKCVQIWRFFFKMMNSGYLKSEKALDSSNLNFLLYFFLVTYMEKMCRNLAIFFTFSKFLAI